MTAMITLFSCVTECYYPLQTVQTLSGHTSPVESVAFDSAEILVAAGASSGLIKLWDLEDTKSKFAFQLGSSVN